MTDPPTQAELEQLAQYDVDAERRDCWRHEAGLDGNGHGHLGLPEVTSAGQPATPRDPYHVDDSSESVAAFEKRSRGRPHLKVPPMTGRYTENAAPYFTNHRKDVTP